MMNVRHNRLLIVLLFGVVLVMAGIRPGPSLAAEASATASDSIKQVVGQIYVAMRKLDAEIFYRHVDMTTVADSLVTDAEALVRGFKKEEMDELAKLSPMLTGYLRKGDLSAARMAARNMLTIDTARWFNVSAKGKIVSALAGDSGLLLKQFHLLAKTNDIHYKGIKYIQAQGNKAMVAITIRIDKYHADIQPIGQMELENGVWRLKRILNAKSLVQRIQTLDRAQWTAVIKASQSKAATTAKAGQSPPAAR